jgi:hypothetical protein
MTCGGGLRLVVSILAFGFGAGPAAADLATCLSQTGYAFQDFGTAARLDGGVTRPFPDSTLCAPPIQGMVNIGDDSGAVLMEYQIGFGLYAFTAAIASPDVSGVSQGFVGFSQFFVFTVIPDDSESDDPIFITITARHDYGGIAASSNGGAAASNSHVTRYDLRVGSNGGPQVLPPWNSELIVPQSGESFDLIQHVDAPVNVKLYLLATLEQQSGAIGSSGANPGSGSAQFASTITYEVSTDAAASIVFDLETLLGLDPPALDVVGVPEPALWLMQFAAVIAIGVGRGVCAQRAREGVNGPRSRPTCQYWD